MPKVTHFAVITVSDSCCIDPSLNCSGPRLIQLIKKHFPNSDIQKFTVPDEKEVIVRKLQDLIKRDHQDDRGDAGRVDCILTTGGTGFGRRDITPEATRSIIDRECPHLSTLLFTDSLQVTRHACLSRGVSGIAGKTLIINLPGSEAAVTRGFQCIYKILPHAFVLLQDDVKQIRKDHEQFKHSLNAAIIEDTQGNFLGNDQESPLPNKFYEMLKEQATVKSTKKNHCHHHDEVAKPHGSRESKYALWTVDEALNLIFDIVQPNPDNISLLADSKSPINVPGFRAALKDGYAMKSSSLPGVKRVIGYISAGDPIDRTPLNDDECFKINTGAPLPDCADCVVQIEDTRLLHNPLNNQDNRAAGGGGGDGGSGSKEDLVDILVQPSANLDVRPIGCDLKRGMKLFQVNDMSTIVVQSMLATVGQQTQLKRPRIVILSTGNELRQPGEIPQPTSVYDVNTVLLKELLQYFGFPHTFNTIVTDDYKKIVETVHSIGRNADVIISTGGVSMGDKDYIKPALDELGYRIHFGRVNMKPGKPLTFASKENSYFFGLPGNPVSVFATFHLFVLPALRWLTGHPLEKCQHPMIKLKLANERLPLDIRPEFMRACVHSVSGELFAEVIGDQMSSRIQSIVGADVLLQLPARTKHKSEIVKGESLMAYTIRYDFISNYTNN